VVAIDAAEAALFGQARAFRLDLRRLAFVPVTPAWFPELERDGHGVLGRAGKALRLTLQAELTTVQRRSPEMLQRLGPLW
jgi:hypothetical protein